MGLKKRGAVYSVIALMLCVAVYLNWNYSRVDDGATVGADTTETGGGKVIGESVLVDSTDSEYVPPSQLETSGSLSGDYFSVARLSRQKARDEAVSILNSTIENENASDDARSVANTNIQLMADNAMVETRIENIIIAKGYSDCVVFINDGSINVIVSKTEEGLTTADVAKIKDVVLEEADVISDQIKIMETT